MSSYCALRVASSSAAEAHEIYILRKAADLAILLIFQRLYNLSQLTVHASGINSWFSRQR